MTPIRSGDIDDMFFTISLENFIFLFLPSIVVFRYTCMLQEVISVYMSVYII